MQSLAHLIDIACRPGYGPEEEYARGELRMRIPVERKVQEGDYMPKGTKVDKIYQAIKKKTGDKGKAARIAQSVTGKSLKTGKKPKRLRKQK